MHKNNKISTTFGNHINDFYETDSIDINEKKHNIKTTNTFGQTVSKYFDEFNINNDFLINKDVGYKCIDLITNKKNLEDGFSSKTLCTLWKVYEEIGQVLTKYSGKNIINDIGQPYHPLETELLDLIDGERSTITINNQERPIEYYKDRKKVNGKKEKPEEFLNRVYRDYIKAEVLYLPYLEKIDPNLHSSLYKQPNGRYLLPTNTDKVDRLHLRAINSGIKIEKLNNLLNRRKKYGLH